MSLPETAIFPGAIVSEANCLNHKNVVPSSTTNVTLAGGSGGSGSSMGSTDTSCVLAAGTGAQLPNDNFVVSIDDEVIFVGSRSTDTLNSLTRGFEGSTATSHANGVAVYGRITAKSHNQLVSEIVAIETALGANLSNVGAPATVVKFYATPNTTAVTKNAATTGDQALMAQTVNAHDWDVANRTLRIIAGGVVTGQATATTLALKVAINGVATLLLFPSITVTSLSNVVWYMDVTLVRTSTGSTGKTSAWGTLNINGNSQPAHLLNVTWDGTVTQTAQVVADFSTSSTTNSITQEFMGIMQGAA